jgi:phage terminase large subunit
MIEEELITSDVFDWNDEATEAVVVNQGGTSSGKTYAILQLLFKRAIEERDLVITVCGQDIPNLKVGALRDADNIVRDCKAFGQSIESFNKTDRVYRFINGSIIEFNSYDDAQDAKSGKRDYLFINEANGIPYAVYEQLALRTKKQVFIDYNPSEEFWVHEKILGGNNVRLIISDHRHNPFVPERIREKIEELKDKDPEMYKVYGRGMTGKIQGLVYTDWSIVDKVPVDAEMIGSGLDFGFSNDPTAYLEVYKYNGELYVDELIYEPGLTNDGIVERFKDYGVSRNQDIIADSSEPKSIREIQNGGYWGCSAVEKGPDSIRAGINILKRFKINITRRSVGLRKEIKSYKWKVDPITQNPLNVPIDFNNHSLDALRYVALMKLSMGAKRSGEINVW